MTREKRIKTVLVAGASCKVGRRLVPALIAAGYKVRALVHKRPLTMPGAEGQRPSPYPLPRKGEGLECIRGDVSDFKSIQRAVAGVDAICQLATTKEDPRTFIDVSVRGTYHLLEAARQCGSIQRWIMAGGDAAMGIYFFPQPGPINEAMPHRAYPGCYALSKVLEEVLGQQYHVQYGLPYVGLRASWIMDDDDILRHLNVGEDHGGIPRWRKHMTAGQRERVKRQTSNRFNRRGRRVRREFRS
jgi:UDP-glucose 4-epimerase